MLGHFKGMTGSNTEKTLFLGGMEKVLFVCLFVCGVSLTSGQLFRALSRKRLNVMFLALVLRHRVGDRIYEMRCLLVAGELNALFIVLPYWDNSYRPT